MHKWCFITDGKMAAILFSPVVLCLTGHDPEDGTVGFAAKTENHKGCAKPQCQESGVKLVCCFLYWWKNGFHFVLPSCVMPCWAWPWKWHCRFCRLRLRRLRTTKAVQNHSAKRREANEYAVPPKLETIVADGVSLVVLCLTGHDPEDGTVSFAA